MLAEHLVADRGDQVEVFTSASLDALTWRDELPPGTEEVDGVTVHRIASEAGRNEAFHPLSQVSWPIPARGGGGAERWVDLPGPLSPALLDAVESSDADVVAFYPYLYYPTIRGLPASERGLSSIRPPMRSRPSICPSLTPCSPSAEDSPSTAQRAAARGRALRRGGHTAGGRRPGGRGGRRIRRGHPGGLRAGGGSLLLCIGRVDDKKGTGILWRYFRSYKERHPGALRLVLVGQVVDPPDEGPDIVVTGLIDDVSKWGLLRGAHAWWPRRPSSPSPSRWSRG